MNWRIVDGHVHIVITANFFFHFGGHDPPLAESTRMMVRNRDIGITKVLSQTPVERLFSRRTHRINKSSV